MATATSVLNPCSPFHIIHLKAVLPTGVIPGYNREVGMAKTSQQQIAGPEGSAVPKKPRSHHQDHFGLGKMASKRMILQQSSSSG